MTNKLPVMDMLSDEMAKVLAFQEEQNKDAFSTQGLSNDQIRENYIQERKYWNEGGASMHRTEDKKIQTRHAEVPVRFHYPDEKDMYPVLIFIHGGGMVVGNNDTHSRIMRQLADETGACVVGIDYSLSPEAKFPQALEECMDVYLDLQKHAQDYRLDISKIGFAGDSGGANLSAGTYLRLRDEGHDVENVKALLLYYGLFGLTDSGSMKLLGGVWDGLTEEDLEYYMDMYLPDRKDSKNPYYNVYEADLTKRMPACFILGLALDPLRDDSRTLAEILQAKDVPVEFIEVPGVLHGYLHYGRSMQSSRDALSRGSAFYKKYIK